MAAVGMVVLLVVGAAAGYYAGSASSSAATTTVTQTGAASTVTVTVTHTGSTTAATSSSTTTPTGSTSTSTSSSGTGTLSMAGINQTLAAACQSAGGQATIYTTEDQPGIWNPYGYPTLQKLFPWFNVNFVGLGSGTVVTKGTAEYQAGHVTADVFGAPLANINRLIAVGAVQPWNNSLEKALDYNATFLDPTGRFHPMWQQPILAIYNTNLVKDPSTLPKTWTDFGNPLWKGKIAINSPSTLSTDALLFASLQPILGNATWTQFMNNLKANSPSLTSDAGGAYTDVSTGQAAIGIGLFNDFYTGLTKAHAPVRTINMTGPIYVSTSVMGLAKNAPHQACGELLIQYQESYPGQTALGLGGTPPVLNPQVTAPTLFKTALPPNVTFVPGAYNQPSFYTNGTYWANLYRSIFGQ